MEYAKTIAINAAVVALVAILLIWGNTRYRQGVQYDRGESALAAGDYVGAIAGYEAALHMYTPGSSLVAEAAAKLWRIGETLERAHDPERALLAYRALRSSFYAARWLVTPGQEWIDRCDARIAALTRQTN